MSEATQNPEKFRTCAKMMVDTMFDNGIFKPHISRDEMKALEDWIAFSMNGHYEMNEKYEALMQRIDAHPKNQANE